MIDIDKYFASDGIIKQKIENFEIRKEQYEMSSYIQKALNEDRKIIIEAGTGTGKTIAYLLPTLLFALENNMRVVISTNTINLQEQLINKDIPLVKEILGRDFKYEIIKGKGNYLCKKKLYNIDVGEDKYASEEEKAEKTVFKNFVKWDEITESGDRSELKEAVSYKIWEKINCEKDLCNGNKCAYYSDCYFFKARKDLANANLLIVNHHMFFSDLSIRKEVGFDTNYSILPNYDIVVFDEAHNIENIARNYATYEISKLEFGKIIGNIHNKRSERYDSSLVFPKFKEYVNRNLPMEDYVKADEYSEELVNNLNEYYRVGIDIFDYLARMFTKNIGNMPEIKLRLDSFKSQNASVWEKVLAKSGEFNNIYSKLLNSRNNLINYINKFNLADEESKIYDFIQHFNRIKNFHLIFSLIISGEDENYIYWCNVNLNKINIKLFATPFDVSKDLHENLFSKMNKFIFTSATLSEGHSFNYFKERVGLNKSSEKILEKIIKSPFDYEKQMKVYIPKNALNPNDIHFLDDITEYVVNTIKYTKGRCFLLFTSYSSMNYLYNKIIRYFDKSEYSFIKQNAYTRNEMIRIFKNSEKPVLFGTDSFWEGVDVQGDQLKSVIIVKLPFQFPGDPVTEAIIEKMKKQQKNSFNDYQLPYAIIKFKQGIGRLIRSKEDTGIITILDNRVIKNNYGQKFLELLPKNIIKDTKENIEKMFGLD